jgi:hypothetical protein
VINFSSTQIDFRNNLQILLKKFWYKKPTMIQPFFFPFFQDGKGAKKRVAAKAL